MRKRIRNQPGWPTVKPKPVEDGFRWLGAILLFGLCLVALLYFFATKGMK